MKKIIIYILMIVCLSFVINKSIDYPFLQITSAFAWCVVGFLLIKTIIENKINKKQ